MKVLLQDVYIEDRVEPLPMQDYSLSSVVLDMLGHGSEGRISLRLMVELWTIYKRNVDPLVKIFHIPTMQTWIHTALASPYSINPARQSALAAIKFAAVTSLDERSC